MQAQSRQRVVLYNPRAEFWTMPLSILAVASALDRTRFEPLLIDGRLLKDPLPVLREAVDGALCLGITVLTGAPIAEAIRVSRILKSEFPSLTVVWGGWHPSIFPEACLEGSSADVTVQGQGENSFTEILERLADGRDLSGSAGCTISRANDSPERQAPRPLVDLNELPRHDYNLIDVEAYFRHKGKRQLDYISSQGCLFRCAFCADPTVYGRQWTGLQPERVGEELEQLWKRWNFTDVNFQDETLFTNSRRMVAIAEQLLGRGVKTTWAGTMRADQGERLSDEAFALCVRSGLRRVLVGVESGSPEMVRRLSKDITLEQVMVVAERCVHHGIAATFPFIVGFPGEDPATVHASIDLARVLRRMSPSFKTPFFFYQPYPGTAISSWVEKVGVYLPKSLAEWAYFDFVGSAGSWVPEQVRSAVSAWTLPEVVEPAIS